MMPTDVKQLFEYHPDLSMQLLAAAGLTNGFKSEVDIYVSPVDQDVLQLVKEQWAKINVNIDIKVLEGATHSSMIYGMTYPGMIYSYWGNASPQSVMGWAHGGVPTSIYAFSKVVDREAELFYLQWAKEADPDKANAMLKAEYLRENKLVWEIPLPTSVGNTCWHQYVRGYRGEVNMGLTSEMGNTSKYKFLWIDQALKQKITGSK
jgi:ABC-type transport system substrate-binding protein